MTDHSVKSIEEKASMFIVSTCQLRSKSFSTVFDCMHDLVTSPWPAPTEYSIQCGSIEEFFILPLNTCIGDIDALLCNTTQLAFTGDFPVLPGDMSGLSDRIEFVKIEPYHKYPGFVRLKTLGEMNYNWKCKKYEFKYTALSDEYLSLNLTSFATSYAVNFNQRRNEVELPRIVCGPAIKSQIDSKIAFGNDTVKALFCPQWPTEAKNWPTRLRKYGWPTMNTISEVVQNGCHVVYSQHRSCRDDELQWRLSFSVAEVILLQSWTQIQQIVYHLLRFFAKKELIQKDCPKEDEVLCPYHIKTLMLWTCEKMPPEWWNSYCVIAISSELLKSLSEWLNRRFCPNYFIPEANLFHEPLNSAIVHQIKRRLKEFGNSGNLSIWFVENYILLITRTLFIDRKTRKPITEFMDCLLPLLESRKKFELNILDFILSLTISNSNETGRTIESCYYSGLRMCVKKEQQPTCNLKSESAMTCLPEIVKILCFRYFANALHSLHVAYSLCYGEISWESSLFVEFVEVMLINPKIRSQHHNFPKTFTEQSSRFQYLRAQSLMEHLTGSNSPSEYQLVSLMSKEFLIKALEYDDSKFNGIVPTALAYLAALHFAISEYETAIRFCSAVLVDQTPQNDKETLNAGCLLFIDDVARVVGLCVLHKKITDSNLQYIGKRLYLDLRFSPEVFAHYLTAFSAETKFKRLDFCHDLPDSAFPMDEYLKALIKKKYIVSMKSDTHFKATRQIVYLRTDSLRVTETSSVNPMIIKETVIDCLMEYVLENMKSFYSVIRNDFGIQCNTVDCYRALYLYKGRQYDAALRLCGRILCESEMKNDFKVFAFTNVLLLPPFVSFYDRDIQSLLGFHTLCYYLSTLNDDSRKYEKTVNQDFENVFVNDMHFNWNDEFTESVLNRHTIRCQYILGRHFVAKYLKVRCCIDCNLPYSEAVTGFAAQKINRPFENIIRRFLLRKLHIIKK